MAKFMVKLDIDDITTSKLGENYIIQAGNVDIIFTPQALDELIKDYEKIKEANTKRKRIGVISYDIEFFLEFIKQFGKPKILNGNVKSQRVGNNIYYCILKSCDLCSHAFDEVRETPLAWENKEYDKIKGSIHFCMNRKR